MHTSSTPGNLLAARAESIAELPPPITATLLPILLNSFLLKLLRNCIASKTLSLLSFKSNSFDTPAPMAMYTN